MISKDSAARLKSSASTCNFELCSSPTNKVKQVKLTLLIHFIYPKVTDIISACNHNHEFFVKNFAFCIFSPQEGFEIQSIFTHQKISV